MIEEIERIEIDGKVKFTIDNDVYFIPLEFEEEAISIIRSIPGWMGMNIGVFEEKFEKYKQ